MEKLLKTELKTSLLKAFGSSGGGCISQGQCYETDHGRVFVKINGKPQVNDDIESCLAIYSCTGERGGNDWEAGIL